MAVGNPPRARRASGACVPAVAHARCPGELSPGFTVHLRDEGPRDAPALLLLHGSNASLHTWEPWVERLSGDYRIITLDLQGHGLTGPTPTGCYTGTCMAETVEAVRAHLGLERMAIGGNSMGGGVAIRYALAHPERVTALILVDSAGARIDSGRRPPIGFRTSVKTAATPEKVDRYWELLRYPGNRRATIERFSAPREPLTPDGLKPLDEIPTLILWGREDQLFPPSAAEWFKQAIPSADLVILDGVGHIPQEEAPDESAGAVKAFMMRHQPTSARVLELQSPA